MCLLNLSQYPWIVRLQACPHPSLILYGAQNQSGHCLQACALQVCLELCAADMPLLQGAAECLEAGITSTLHPANARAAAAVSSDLQAGHEILTDPQTAGGLVAGIPEAQAAACVAELHRIGYSDACIIGKTCSSLQPPQLIQLV